MFRMDVFCKIILWICIKYEDKNGLVADNPRFTSPGRKFEDTLPILGVAMTHPHIPSSRVALEGTDY